jgi:predicted protein tyrosine phosphatase
MQSLGDAPLRVTICGISELALHGTAGITHVLSILDPDWPAPDEFSDFPPHRRVELRFHDVIVESPGIILPTAKDVALLLALGQEAMAAGSGAHLLIHCHAGISRSTAAAALCLMQANPARSAYEAFAEIGRLRARAWPNLRLLELGEMALGRPGEIVGAVGLLYRRVLDAQPHFGEFMVSAGRTREIELAEGFKPVP